MGSGQIHQTIDYPTFLAGTTELKQHLDHRWKGESSTEKGRQFAEFARTLMPRTESGKNFPMPEMSGLSHDDGVDLRAESLTEEGNAQPHYLLVQSKYSITERADIDAIISKFEHYYKSKHSNGAFQPFLFGEPALNQFRFAIVTASKTEGVVTAYESSSLSSKQFYERLVQESLLEIIDIGAILAHLKDVYRKSMAVPPRIRLNFTQGPLCADGVYVGIVTGSELVRVYREFGDALFYDNIREFLGLYSGRQQAKQDGPTVNEMIVKTIKETPSLFLQRNNGVVLRAKSVQQAEDGAWELEEGNIINGCQTTMCLVHHLSDDCLVHAKIVTSADSWEVAKAANYQTHISIIDLNLAQYLRPQVVAKFGSHFDTRVTNRQEDSAFMLIDTINRREIAYEEIKHLFIGLFSSKPNNIFESNYTTLRTDIVEYVFASQQDQGLVFETLFLLHQESIAASDEAAQTFTDARYAPLLQRFYRTTKTDYHAFLTLLATTAAVGQNPIQSDGGSTRSNVAQDYQSLLDFVRTARSLVENEPEQFRRYFRHGFKALALKSIASGDSDDQILKRMHSDVTSQSFVGLLREVVLLADDDPQITWKPKSVLMPSASRTAKGAVQRKPPRSHR